MINAAGILALFATALLITVADTLIKKISTGVTLSQAILNPWMLIICTLYFIQIVIAAYVFISHGELAVYANLFIVFYSILMVLSGVMLFRETLTMRQVVGIVLALGGAILLNS
ncbi:MAG: hypothetical protein ACREGH_02610 [Minisyncoccia bacterium]